MQINIGLKEQDRKDIADGVARVLADSYTLYLKTHNYHWNVTGPMFQTLHVMFEEQYQDLALAVDDIAERIRSLGERAPGTYAAFSKLTTIEEDSGNPNAKEMIANLVESNEKLIRTAREVIPKAADAGDEATVDLLTARMQHHEKTTWMLRSLLED
jgi:starvation-inducible DNA-binding protein